MIVDDEAAFTRAAKLAFEGKENYEVCVENDPRTALVTARKFQPDIIVLDVVMPELDGGEVHRQFLTDPVLKDIPVIFLTAIVQQKEVAERNGMIGGSFYIAKPVDAGELINAIDEHIHS